MNLIFVSSPQAEFAHVRKELCYFVLTDPYLKQFFDVFLFENLPANQRNPQQNYQGKVEECEIYLGLFGKTYGTPDGEGLSATEREFDYATELGKDRIVFIQSLSPRARQAKKMAELIARAQLEVTFDTFGSLEELKRKVMQSLLYWQQDQNRRPLP
jgi:ATP-dependent DNA helicase RecG